MFTQLLGTVATVYGVLAALTALLQTRQMLARRSSRAVSAGFLASYAGGYAIWLAYGLSAGSLPLIVVDTVGLLCGGLTLAVAMSLRSSLIRPATPNSRTRGARWTASARNTAQIRQPSAMTASAFSSSPHTSRPHERGAAPRALDDQLGCTELEIPSDSPRYRASHHPAP